MINRETALRIYCALLSRDPLSQQRFTVLGERFEQLAHLANSAAKQFEDVAEMWAMQGKRAEEIAAALWDLRSISIEPLKQPKNLLSTDDEHRLPKSQGDLLGELKQ